MFKYLKIIMLSLFLTACGSSEIIIPEGTEPAVAEVMKKHRLSQSNAVILIDAFENNSSFSNSSIDDVSSVMQKMIRGRRVLEVNMAGRNKMYINLD